MSAHDSPTPESRKNSRHTLSGALVVTGIAIAVINMALAWVMMFTRPTGIPSTNISAQISSVEKKATTSDSSMEFLTQMLTPLVRSYELKGVGEQNVLVLAIAFSFALLSVGFSLFVMGIEGALSLRGEVADMGKLVLRTASPGVLCILFSTAILATLLVLTQVKFGDTQEAAKAELIRAEAQAKTQQTIAEESARFKRQMDEDSAKFQRKMDEDRINFEREMERYRVKVEHQVELERARWGTPSAPASRNK